MSAAQVLELLARYDDDALAALASRGLLRRARKDLEAAAPVVRADGDEVVVETGGHVVRFGATGAVGAACTCPATGVCQHVLTAVLAAAAGAVAGSPADELAAVPSSDLLGISGAPGYRWAWQLVEDLEAEDGVRIDVGRAVVVRFVRPAMTFRYVGGPVVGIVVDPPTTQPDRYRVAAVLAYQRACGLSPAAPPAPRRRGPAPGQEGLDLGREHLADGSRAAQQEQARRRVRAAVTSLATECVVLGLAHLSPAVQERFAALALSARAAGYHRLALGLRRLADHVDLLLERHAAADEQRLLDELAVTAALVAALDAAAAEGRERAHLVGRARGSFDASGPLDLVGLGARPWHSASGYVGLTAVFLSVATGTYLSWTEARPASVGGLDPVARYRAAGPWTGLASPAAATGRRVVLVGAKVSEGGRLSGAAGTSATVAPYSGDLTRALAPQASWAHLGAGFGARRRGLLAAPDPMADWVTLAPAQFGPLRFDENRQTLDWPLVDADGDVLPVRLGYDPLTAPAIARLERLCAAAPASGTLVVARLVRTPDGLVAEPLSVVHPVTGADGVRVETLSFPGTSAVGSTGTGPGTASAVADVPTVTDDEDAPGDDDATGTETAFAAAPGPVRELRAWLQRTAERGLSPAALPAATADLVRLTDRASSAGLTAFGPLGRPAADAHALAGRLLRAQALCLQHERLAGTDPV